MPLLKRKAVEDLVAGKDLLYSRAGNFAMAGSVVTDSLIQRLLRHRAPVVTVIYPSREEAAKGLGAPEIEALVKEREGQELSLLRSRLFEAAKKIYKPYSELTSRAFWGKLGEKLIKPDFLLERQPAVLYRQGIYMGSLSLFGSSDSNNQYNDLKAVLSCLDGLYGLLDREDCPRLFLDSVRLGAIYDADLRDRVRIIDPGNSFAWHATDTAILCLAALAGMSRRRKAQGLPESTQEFEKQKNRITSHRTIEVKSERFHYPRETVVDAALGCLLHGLGFAHITVNRIASRRPLFDASAASLADLKTMRKSQYAVRNLFEERVDVSSIAKKIIFQMKQYPDGSGYPFPDTDEPALIPEYARMAVIADDYDELVNPVLSPHPMGRTEAIGLLRRRSGDYGQGGGRARYDKVLVEDFLKVLKPFETNERVDLYLGGRRSHKYYSGFARGGEAGLIPQVCVLKNMAAGESYAFGRVVFDLEAQRVLLLDEQGRPGAVLERAMMDERDQGGGFRIKNPKIREMLRQLPELVGLDDLREAWALEDYSDPVFGVSRTVGKAG